ncbi:MAG: hypothetical protein G8237_12275, partial [Magnetococcales bacterium]|nr:hypothetical protein [Magnetococcales bacterium]
PDVFVQRVRAIHDENGTARVVTETVEERDARIESHRPHIRVEDGEPSLSLAKDAFIPMTVLMLQRAIRRIEALEERVGVLEG